MTETKYQYQLNLGMEAIIMILEDNMILVEYWRDPNTHAIEWRHNVSHIFMDADVDDLMSDLDQKQEFFYDMLSKFRHTQDLNMAVRRLTAKSVWHFTAKPRDVSRPRDWMLQCSYRYGIRQASRQRCCRGAGQMSDQLQKFKPESRGF